MQELEAAKEAAAKEVVEKIFDSLNERIVLGIGSGTTILHFIRHLANRLLQQRCSSIRCVPTSHQSKRALLEYPQCFQIVDWYLVAEIDIYVDGADAVLPSLFMAKGRGGALFEEKLAFRISKSIFIIGDWTKTVDSLEPCIIPIEILPAAQRFVSNQLHQYAVSIKLREGTGKVGPVTTDNGNFLLDVVFRPEALHDLSKLESMIKSITGVVESGIFCPKPNTTVIICEKDGAISEYFY